MFRHASCAFARCALAHSRRIRLEQVQYSGKRYAGYEASLFSPESFPAPKLPHSLQVHDVPLQIASNESLEGLGLLVDDPNDFTTAKKTFEIVKWPKQGWRDLDPGTGDEAGTTEGNFEVWWQGHFYYGKNYAIATENNFYLDGLGALPEHASTSATDRPDCIYLWMSDYHPDGGQLFWPHEPCQFTVCLGPASKGDEIQPEDMRAFSVPIGKGVYLHPGTWHNGFYVPPEYTRNGPVRCLTRQGRVHARISASWAHEFGKILRVPLK